MITLQRIKNIAQDIKEDKEWINDSHTQSEYTGICDGLDRLIHHLEETKDIEQDMFLKNSGWKSLVTKDGFAWFGGKSHYNLVNHLPEDEIEDVNLEDIDFLVCGWRV